MVILGDTIDPATLSGPVYDEQPVDDVDDYDLSGTEFYNKEVGDMYESIRRWFFVVLDKNDDGGYNVSVEVHDQKFLNSVAPSAAGPEFDKEVTEIEKEFEKPDYDPVLPWVKDEIEKWLSEWDSEHPPTGHEAN